jgi:hypothetical protein
LTYSGLDEGIAAVDELWSALSEGRAA